MATIGTRLFTRFYGEPVGEDRFGNRYFRHRRDPKRRWVLYNGQPEASKVPPEWHAWLVQTMDQPPPKDLPHRVWQKEHLPNLTGTELAYRPPGAVSHGGKRPKATGDYDAWTPE